MQSIADPTSHAGAETVEVTQCRFRSGADLLLLRPGRYGEYAMLFARPDGATDPSSITEREDGTIDIETNGGVASYNAVGELFAELRSQHFVRIRAAELAQRIGAANVAECRNPYKDGTR